MKIAFTQSEIDILDHRLQVPDAIADALESDFPHTGDVQDLVRQLCHYVKIDRAIEAVALPELEKAILADALEGSTFFASSEDALALGEISRGQLLNWHNAANSLEQKISNLLGRNIHIPRN